MNYNNVRKKRIIGSCWLNDDLLLGIYGWNAFRLE